jgi:hypothetical protein
MQGFLTIVSQALGFGDPTPNNDPALKYFDWKKNVQALPCANPGRSPPGTLALGLSTVVFDGTRTLTIDGTTAFGVTLSPLNAGTRYRFTWTGGTNPTLRTDRGLTLNTLAVTFSIGANQVADVTLSGNSFGSTAAGDTVFIPGVTTGDAAGPFNSQNEGFWTVLAVLTSTHIQMARAPGTSFSGASETQTVTANSQFVAFTAAGVQPADSVTISAGFPVADEKTFVVDKVTSTWFEVISSLPLATVSGATPGAAGMQFYSTVKRWIRVEVDQQAVVQLNADSTMNNVLIPVVPADINNMGWLEKFGPTYKVTIVNQSASTLNFSVFSAE